MTLVKLIRDDIKVKYSGVFFDENELSKELVNIIKTHKVVDDDADEVLATVACFLRKSQKNKKYYFNTDRKNPPTRYKSLIGVLTSGFKLSIVFATPSRCQIVG